MYTLKSNVPDFEMVDGPLAGRKFQAGKTYTEIPAGYEDRFNPDSSHPDLAPRTSYLEPPAEGGDDGGE